ncbi:MAG: type II toxin-antitoxin system VapC family toxin [Thermoanaerobaculia bacterium]
MSTYLADTSVLIDVLRGVPDRVERLKALVEAGHILACSAITVAELFAGMRQRERTVTVGLLDSLEHFDVTRPIAEKAGLLRREWATKGRTFSLPDLLIAATAISHGLILITDNVKDFPMKELELHELAE